MADGYGGRGDILEAAGEEEILGRGGRAEGKARSETGREGRRAAGQWGSMWDTCRDVS